MGFHINLFFVGFNRNGGFFHDTPKVFGSVSC